MEVPEAKLTADNDVSGSSKEDESTSNNLLHELQTNLEQQMMLKAEVENRARKERQELQATIDRQRKELEQLDEIRKAFEQQLSAKAEAEHDARQARQRVEELQRKLQEQDHGNVDRLNQDNEETENGLREALEQMESLQASKDEEIENLQRIVIDLREANETQKHEMQRLRDDLEEQHHKEMALTSRLNAAKMKEAEKANLAESYEDEINGIRRELETTKADLLAARLERTRMEEELNQIKKSSSELIAQAQHALAEERSLNEERKRKMKAFVESKAEELRQANADTESMRLELSQANQSLLDLNNRWKQLHAQYVQSQTRNRELQRDLNRIKKDSENLHKVGDTLEMKLSKSATETEEHKNKRLAAKHELMTVLRTLEAEREICSKLKDSLKFSFTPKALSQQQLLNESLEDFESQLQKLARRLGRALPPPSSESHVSSDLADASEQPHEENGTEDGESQKFTRTDAEINRLISKLERETQKVSQCIMTLTSSVERMHILLDSSGERNCVTVLSEILLTGGVYSNPTIVEGEADETETGDANRRRLGSYTGHRYGSVPSASMN